MRAHVIVVLERTDHPDVEVDDDGDLVVHLNATTRIMGPQADVRRWADELAMRLAVL